LQKIPKVQRLEEGSNHYEDTVWEFTIEFVRMIKNKSHFHGEEKNSISVSTLWQYLQSVAGKVF